MTASAPCSMVSLILSCFSSVREICSDTRTLLIGLERMILAQEADHRWAGHGLGARVAEFTLSCEKHWASPKGNGMVLILEHAGSWHSLGRRRLADRWGIRRP